VKHRLDTRLVHAGEPRPRIAGAVTMPVFQSSTFEMAGDAAYDEIRYVRLNNTPNHDALHAKLAALEGSEAALVSGSGMAAISAALLTVLKTGDHLIAQRCLYGGTHELVTGDLAQLGIEHTFVDPEDPAAWAAALRPTTRAFYCETLTNPLLDFGDLPGIARFARERGLVSLVDSTFASPVNFRPIEHGFDLVLHSATKYLNGHSDIAAGVVAGSGALVDRVRRKLNHLGGVLDPHACFLLHRGLKTLGVRVRHQNASAMMVARFLVEHPKVAMVRYPGLPQHPNHARAKELLHGFGGMIAFEPKDGLAATQKLFARMELAVDAPSLGGPETLVTRPAQTSHVGLGAERRAALGIRDGLVRMSIGLEAPEDLVADLEQALAD
jgi:cystathionine beta-lyase/cystathionine gamma-synthase